MNQKLTPHSGACFSMAEASGGIATTRNRLVSTSMLRRGSALLLACLLGIFVAMPSMAQVTTNSGSGLAASYPSLADAITALNAATISSPVTITLSGNETAPAGGYVITASGDATNTITIQGSSSTITAGIQTAGIQHDAIFKIVGGDYITLQNFTMQENAGNTVVTPIGSQTMTEFGVAIYLASATNGAQNNTIQNNTISLSSTYPNAMGIMSTSSNSSTHGTLEATATTGTNSNNKFYNNTISNVAYGFYFLCPPITTTIFESGIEVGGNSSGTGNNITFGIAAATTISNLNRFSGTLPAAITFRNGGAGSSVRHNTITSNSLAYTQTLGVGGIVTTLGTAATGVTYTTTWSNNTITLTNNGSTPLLAIDFGYGLNTGTIVGNNNTITLNNTPVAAASGNMTGIRASYASATNTLNGNTITTVQSPTTAGSTTRSINGINAAGAGSTVNVNNNTITVQQNAPTGTATYGSGAITYIDVSASSGTVNVNSNQLLTTGSTIRSTGTCIGINHTSGTITVGITIDQNTINIDRVASSGTISATNESTTPSTVAHTITNNAITFTSLAGTSLANGIVTLGGTSATGTVKSINNNTISISGTNTGTSIGIQIGYSNGTMNNNSVTISCAAATITAFQATSTGARAHTMTGNTLSLTSSSTSPTSMIGFNVGATGPFTIHSNTFTAMNLTGIITSSPTITGISIAAGDGNNIYNHNITNITAGAASSTGSPVIRGIAVTAGTLTNIYKNKIFGITTPATGANTLVSGITIAGGTTNNIYNNIIGDLTATAASGNDMVRGINITSTTASSESNVSFNTVYLNAVSTGANFGTSGIFHTASVTSTTAALNLRNNIIVNSSTPSGTGLTVAYRRGGRNSLANYNPSSDRNLFYAGTPGSANLIYVDSTNSVQTMSAYKAGAFSSGTVAPRDAFSFSENVTFQSTSSSSADFLKIDLGVATQIESAGSPIAGITDDFFGTTRSTTTPDVGAFEAELTGLDLTPPSISYTALPNTALTGNRTLSATISDPSGIPTSGSGLPVLYWNVNNGLYNSATGVHQSGSTYNFSFGAGVSTGDVVRYFIVAQDDASTPNVGAFPSTGASSFTSNPPAAGTAPTSPSSYTVAPAFSGTYLVGAGETYTTLTDSVGGFFRALNEGAATGNIIVEITSDIAETGQNALNQIADDGNGYTLTIRPSAATNRVISSRVANGLIRLNGADKVIIDGRHGGSGRFITIRNMNTSNPAITFINGASQNELRHINIEAATTSTSNGAVLFSTGANDNNLISNCHIRDRSDSTARPANGIYFNALTNTNTIIENNDIFDFTTNGINLNLAASTTIRNNRIFHNNSSSVTTIFGILIANANNTSVLANAIYDIRSTATTPAIAGIHYLGVNGTMSAQAINNTIALGTGVTAGTIRGIDYFGWTPNVFEVYHNSVHISGTGVTGSSQTAAFIKRDEANTLNVRNNAFVNTRSNGTGTGNHFAIVISNTVVTTQTLNFNAYFHSGTGGVLGLFNTTNQTTIADWRTASAGDANSINSDPGFQSATDLRPTLGSPALGAGTPIGTVTTDFAGNARSATAPAIGAYESGADAQGPQISYTALGNISTFTARTLTASISDVSGVPTSGAGLPVLYWRVNNGSWASATGAHVSGNNYEFSFGAGVSLADTIRYYIVAQDLVSTPNVSAFPAAGASGFSASPPAAATPPTSPSSYIIVSPPLAGDYNIGVGGDYTTLTAVANDLSIRGVSASVRLLLTDTAYNTGETYPITFTNIAGISSSNTVSLMPAAGVTTRIASSQTANAIIRLQNISNIIIDGRQGGTGTSQSLTITNSANSSSGHTLILIDGATNNTIRDAIIGNGGAATAGNACILMSTAATNPSGNSNNLILNNLFEGGRNSVFESGTTSNLNNNNVYEGNTFRNFGFASFQTANCSNIKIRNNVFTTTTPINTANSGVSIGTTASGTIDITGNRFEDIQNTATTSVRGITASPATGAILNIHNNVFIDNTNNGTKTSVYLLQLAGSNEYTANVHFNSFFLGGTHTGGTSGSIVSIGFIQSNTNASTVVNFRNNAVRSVRTGGDGLHIGAGFASVTGTINANNNVYFSNGGATSFQALWGTTAYNALATYQGVAGTNESTTRFVNPNFVSSTNLRPLSISVLVGNGTPISGITTDFAGATRSLTTPTIGAFEGSVINTWTGTGTWTTSSNWSLGTPASGDHVLIGSGAVEATSAGNTINSITVNSGATVTIPSGTSLTVNGVLANNGTFTVQNGGHLLQGASSTIGGSGTFNATRNSGNTSNLVYNMWSSPNSTSTLSNLGGTDWYFFNETSQAWSNTGLTGSSVMSAGRGYSSTGAGNVTFTGTFNNGAVTPAVGTSGQGWNLVGNPYPSSVSGTSFLAGNTNIEGTLWFWSQPTAATVGNSGGDYATWTTLGGTAGSAGGATPDGNIGLAQGFFVKANSGSTVSFANSMRSANAGSNFRLAGERAWFNLTGSNNLFNQILLGFSSGASDQRDAADATKLKGNTQIAFYSLLGADQLAIQAMAERGTATRIVPVGFDVATAGAYSLSLDRTESMPANVDIFLKDNLTGSMHNLRNQAYGFAVANAGSFTNRFEIHFGVGLATSVNSLTAENVRIFGAGQSLFVQGFAEGTVVERFEVRDAAGRLVMELNRPQNADLERMEMNVAAGVYLARIVTNNGIKTERVYLSK